MSYRNDNCTNFTVIIFIWKKESKIFVQERPFFGSMKYVNNYAIERINAEILLCDIIYIKKMKKFKNFRQEWQTDRNSWVG